MNTKNFFLLNIFFAFLLFSGCANSQSAKVKTMSQTEFKKSYDKQKKTQIVDVRTPDEIAQGKISDATELDYFDPNFKKKIEAINFDKSKPMIVYCAVGGRSSKAAAILVDLGFKSVYNLEGGYNGYK
jgi:phage shock protein E